MGLIGKWTKQPSEVLAYPVDFSDWLAERPGNTISGRTVTAEAGITVVSHSLNGSVVSVLLGGGTSGTTYKITVEVDVAPSGEHKEADFTVRVKAV